MSDTPTRDEFNALVSRLEAVEQENEELREENNSLRGELESLERHFEAKHNELRSDVDDLQRQLSRAKKSPAELSKDFAETQSLVEALQNKVSHLNEQVFSDDEPAEKLPDGCYGRDNQYDQYVLKRLDADETYTRRALIQMYHESGLRNESKKKEYTKNLLKSRHFEGVGSGQFQFLGRDI